MKEILVKVYQLPKIDIPFNAEEYLHKLDSMDCLLYTSRCV